MNIAVRISETEIRLREENEVLREKVRQLTEALAANDMDVSPTWKLTGSEAVIYRNLLKHKGGRTKEQLHFALYGFNEIETNVGIVDTFICRMRDKLEPFGCKIGTRWNNGYELIQAAYIPDVCLSQPADAETAYGLVSILFATTASHRRGGKLFLMIVRQLAMANGHMVDSRQIAKAVYGAGKEPKDRRRIISRSIVQGRPLLKEWGWEIASSAGGGGGYCLRKRRGA